MSSVTFAATTFPRTATYPTNFLVPLPRKSKDLLQNPTPGQYATWFRKHKLCIMVHSSLSASVQSPTVDVIVDLGHPLLNYSVDGLIKVGGVGAAHSIVQDTFSILRSEKLTKDDLQNLVKKAGTDGLRWGVVGGVYAGVEYSLERACGKQDWTHAALGGALTGAILSLGDGNFSKDKMIQHAITGGALATASEFVRNLI